MVWLRPHPIVAKVAIRARSRDEVRREHAVALELGALGAEAARPITGTQPISDSRTGFVVTLWERLEGSDRVPVPPEELAESLRRLHDVPGRTEVQLPSFRGMIVDASRALEDETFTANFPHSDRQLLHTSYRQGFDDLASTRFEERRLHGEPHYGNRIVTSQGIRWIDFESSCNGPVEWDLAFQPDEVVCLFPDADLGLLALLRRLNSAPVATWCLRSRHPEMLEHGEIHLLLLRQPSVDPWRHPGIP